MSLCTTVTLLAGTARASLSPGETVVVVNADSWVSRAVANEYITLRDIPHSNVVMLKGLGIRDGIAVNEFRDQILKPILSACGNRGLTQRLSCVVYSADFPTWVDIAPDLGRKGVPRIVGSKAALTGLTYLYQDALAANPDYVDLGVNWYARRQQRVFAQSTSWDDDDRAAYKEVEAFFQEKKRRTKAAEQADAAESERWLRNQWQRVLTILTDLARRYPDHPQLIYNLACAQAQNGRLRQAVETLDTAAELGFTDVQHIKSDDDLQPVRHREDFQAVVAKLMDWRPDMPPPLPFSGRTGWTPSGRPVTPYKGARYLISAMLGVTSGRGNSFDEVITCLRSAAGADASAPDGTIYFMKNADVRSRCRAWAVKSAAEGVGNNGVKAEILGGVLPRDKDDVAGLFTGTASFAWQRSDSRIQPGAICEHLTSFGGVMRENAGQTPLSAFIRHGAAGTAGTVCEPFAIQAKFPTAFIQDYYTAGFSLGEAFYLSVAAPYQLLIVGDPLCTPWAKPPRVTIQGVEANQSVHADTLSLKLRSDDEGGLASLHEATWTIDGRAVAARAPKADFDLPIARFPAGWHQVTVTVVRKDRTATRGRASVPFFVRGDRSDFDVLSADKTTLSWGEAARLTRRGSSQGRLAITWMGNEVAAMEPGQSSVNLSTRDLAIGKVTLRPVLLKGNAASLIPVPVELDIRPPEPTSAAPAGLLPVLGKGLRLTVGGATTVHDGKATGDWLKKAGVRKGDAITVDAWFETDDEGLAQFQFKGNVPLDKAVTVDGKPCHVQDGDHWRSVPVNLRPGAHRLTIRTIGVENAALNIRFGQTGTKTVDGDTFRHK